MGIPESEEPVSSSASLESSLCKTCTGCALKSPRLARVFTLWSLLIGVTPRARCPEDLPKRSQSLRIVGQLLLPALDGPKRLQQARVHNDARPEVGVSGRVLACRAGRRAREARGRRARPPSGSCRAAAAAREPRRARRAVGTRALPGLKPTPSYRLPSARQGPPPTYR